MERWCGVQALCGAGDIKNLGRSHKKNGGFKNDDVVVNLIYQRRKKFKFENKNDIGIILWG